jgi:hypothetical protein
VFVSSVSTSSSARTSIDTPVSTISSIRDPGELDLTDLQQNSQKLDFLLESTNQDFLSHIDGSSGSVFDKMAAEFLD